MRFFMKGVKRKVRRADVMACLHIRTWEKWLIIQGGKAPRGRSRQSSMVDEVLKPKEQRALSREPLPAIEKVTSE